MLSNAHLIYEEDGAKVVVQTERADVVRISRFLLVLGNLVSGDQHLVNIHRAQWRLHILVPIDPGDSGGSIDVLQQLVLFVRLHDAVYRHCANLLLVLLHASHPYATMYRAAHVQSSLHLRLLCLIRISLVCNVRFAREI